MQLPIPNSKPVQMGLCVGLVVLIALVVFFGPVGQKLGAFLPSEPKTAPALPQVRNPATPFSSHQFTMSKSSFFNLGLFQFRSGCSFANICR